jgi:hypothetical protein
MDNNKNPTLSDVMNAIITSVSKGRQAADFEAMKSAMMYQKIDLLKGLPVPRMRINNIKVSIPMILSNITPATEADHKPVTQISSDASKIFVKELQASIKWIGSGIKMLDTSGTETNIQFTGSPETNIQLKSLNTFVDIFKSINASQVTHFQEDLEQRLSFDLAMYKSDMNGMISEQGLQNIVGTSTEASLLLVIKSGIFNWIKERVAAKEGVTFDIDRASNSVEKRYKDKIVIGLLKKIKFSIESTSIEQQAVNSQVEVLVDTESIKNAGGGPDTVTRLSFVLREEGLEWITETDQDNNSNHKLITE